MRPLLTAAASASLALLAAALFFGGGSGDNGVFWIGSAAVVLAAVGVVAVLLGVVPAPALDAWALAFVGLFAGLVVWTAVSVLWSDEPDRSWAYFNRGLVYLAFLGVGLLAGTLVARAPTRLAAAVAVLLGGVLVWALAGKVFPGLFPDGARRARLRSPVGYWNALALLGATAVPLALWVVARARARLRIAGVVLLYLALVAILLTYSRGGLLLAAGAAVVWLALNEERFEGLAALVAAGLPGAAVAGYAFTLSGVADDRQAHATRVADGARFGVALVIGLVVAAVLGWLAGRFEPAPDVKRRLVRGAVVAAAAVAVAVVGGLVARAGGPAAFWDARVSEFKSQQTVQDVPGRLGNVASNNRFAWWREAARGFGDNPVVGTGAGSFQVTHRRLRKNGFDVREPHSLPLQLLTELGIVGFALGAGAAVAGVVAVRRAIGRLSDVEQPAAGALTIAAALYFVQALFDIDWDFLAASGLAFFVVGVLLAGRPRVRARETSWALAVAAVAAACLYSLAAPWLAERKVQQAYDAIEAGLSGRPAELDRAVSKARSAHALNPVSVDPLIAWGAAEEAKGDNLAARRRYAQAIEVQPESRDAQYEFGRFELRVTHETADAYYHFNQAFALDRYFAENNALLLEARCKLNPTGCPKR